MAPSDGVGTSDAHALSDAHDAVGPIGDTGAMGLLHTADAPDASLPALSCPGAPATTYSCPGGTKVPLCACGPSGYACEAHPEAQCPTLCGEGASARWPCSDGSTVPWCACDAPECAPVCDPAGASGAGWYDSCSKTLIQKGACLKNCTAVCSAIGSKSEGWTDGCTGELITSASCAPQWNCAAKPNAACPSPMCHVTTYTQYACPGGTQVPFCTCMSAAADCRPQCKNVGTQDEGWFGGCDGKLQKLEACAECTSSCGAIGSKSEGWYSSCTGLIGWTQCATGIWSCKEAPWSACGMVATPATACLTDSQCGVGLSCVKGVNPVGVCSRVCNPTAPDCGVGLVCAALPNFAAPGFCVTPCASQSDCGDQLSCGSEPTGAAPQATCYAWPACDPIKDTGCGASEQCRVTGDAAHCGAKGKLPLGAKCQPAVDSCGPGLGCGPLDQCRPTCTDDLQCKAVQYDFCLKKPATAAFGWCMVLE